MKNEVEKKLGISSKQLRKLVDSGKPIPPALAEKIRAAAAAFTTINK